MSEDLFEFQFNCTKGGCGTHSARVRWRGEGEDILSWMHDVREAARKVHPISCTGQGFSLMLPMPAGDEWPVGQKRTVN